MSSREDLKLMISDAWRDKLATAISSSIDEFFAPRLAGAQPTGALSGR
ncbi:MAG: hypothetical protein B7Z45_09235 [Azorhizobium sp. 12-66-6]|nr:MAG: hypothetical protein B7Z45_09235 [Azorhizobium sp. 12-66-6]